MTTPSKSSIKVPSVAAERFEERDIVFQLVVIKTDIAERLQLRLGSKDLQVGVARVAGVEDRAGRRIDIDLRGRAQMTEHDVAGGVHVGAVGHRDLAAARLVGVGLQGHRRVADLGVDVAESRETDVAPGPQRHLAAEGGDGGVDDDVHGSGPINIPTLAIDRFVHPEGAHRVNRHDAERVDAVQGADVADVEIADVVHPDAAAGDSRLQTLQLSVQGIARAADAKLGEQKRAGGDDARGRAAIDDVALRGDRDEPVGERIGRVSHAVAQGRDQANGREPIDDQRDVAIDGRVVADIEVGHAVDERVQLDQAIQVALQDPGWCAASLRR